VPDLPLEETDIIRDAAGKAGLELVLLTTPTTPVDRAARIAAASQGFVYLVSVAGAIKSNTYHKAFNRGVAASNPK
jgi:tryptophan synthase alpha chain